MIYFVKVIATDEDFIEEETILMECIGENDEEGQDCLEDIIDVIDAHSPMNMLRERNYLKDKIDEQRANKKCRKND